MGVFDAAADNARPQFAVVEGIGPEGPEIIAAVAAATAGEVQPVLLLDREPAQAMAGELREAGWRLTDARPLLTDEL